MTALVSAFSRAYHSENNDIKIFDDSVAGSLLSEEEYNQIAKSMAQGIQFFYPGFTGSDADALRWIVDNPRRRWEDPLLLSKHYEMQSIMGRDNTLSLPQDTIASPTGSPNGLPSSKYLSLIILL